MSPYVPIHTTATIRELEDAAPAELRPLMDRAGAAAARHALRMLGTAPERPGHRVLVLAGPGNNGGDAFEAAVHLKDAWCDVTLVFTGARDRLPEDARRAFGKWEAAGGKVAGEIPVGSPFDLVIDGLFGIGLARPLDGRHAELVHQANALHAPILALDIPSGVNGDTGAVMGCAIRATETVTFIALKAGLLTLDGPDHCGRVHVETLGLDVGSMQTPPGEWLDGRSREALPARPNNFHKGNAGEVAIVGGARGMTGAAFIAGRAAIRTGAGKVFLGLIGEDAPAFDVLQPELMTRSASSAMADASVIVAGPGMGASSLAAMRAAVAADKPLVLDADALNLIGAHPPLADATAARKAPTIMTPHPAEAARLLGASTADVQRHRVTAACAMAERYRAFVVLKGNGSVIARPGTAGDSQTHWWINASGNPGMASAGMGDALAGMVGSLLAQGLPPLEALQLAVWLHGAAADRLAARGEGPIGITASDVIDEARRMLNAG